MTGLMGRAAIGLLKLYKVTLSPAFYAMGVRCRHEPTCSTYAIDAYRLYPPLKATKLTAGRLLRCRPGGTHGYDPVPEPDAAETHGIEQAAQK